MEKIKLIVFDIDGTLADTDDYYVEKCSGILSKILPFLSNRSIESITRPLVMACETLLHAFYRVLDLFGMDGVISRLHNRISVSQDYKYEEIPGMRETLISLSSQYTLGIISSGGRTSTNAFLEKYKLTECISYIVSAEDCRYIKPHPGPLLQIASKAGISPGDCMLVGDTIFDILCAKRAGAVSVAVKTGFDTTWVLKAHHPDFIMESVSDLPELLRQTGKTEGTDL